METNRELNNEVNEEHELEQHPETGNLTICPNCLEPNTDDLAVCRYCGMPLHQGAEGDLSAIEEDEEMLAASRAAAVPPEKKEPKKAQEGGFRRAMPWIGLYIIYYAVTGIFDTSRKIKSDPEGVVNPTLAYASWGIYIIAGLLMCWPLLKKGWRKLFPVPEEPEEAQAEETASETIADQNTEDTWGAGTENFDEITEPVSEAETAEEPQDEKDTDEESENTSNRE